MNEIIIYESSENKVQVEVEFDGDTVWLSLNQLTMLFDRDKSVISRHLNNIFKADELKKDSVVAKYATTASDGKTYQVDYYNLDAIISVGYRVNSKQGTQFRIWANNVLKEYLVKGHAINEKRLAQKEQEVQILKNRIQILTRVIEDKTADNEWLGVFAKGLTLLDDYDHEQLDVTGLTIKEARYPDLEDYQVLIHDMVAKFDSEIFGRSSIRQNF